MGFHARNARMQGYSEARGGLVSIYGGGSVSVSVVGSTLSRISAVRNVEYASTVLYPSSATCSKGRPGSGKPAQRMITQAYYGGLVYISQGSSGNVSVVDSTLSRISAVRNVEYASAVLDPSSAT